MFRAILSLLILSTCALNAQVTRLYQFNKNDSHPEFIRMLNDEIDQLYNVYLQYATGSRSGLVMLADHNESDFMKAMRSDDPRIATIASGIFGDIQCNSISINSRLELIGAVKLTRDSDGNAVFDTVGDYAIFKDTIYVKDTPFLIVDPTGTGQYNSTFTATSDGITLNPGQSFVINGKLITNGDIEARGDLTVNGNATIKDSATITAALYVSSTVSIGTSVRILTTGTIYTDGNIYGANANYTEGMIDLPTLTDNSNGTATIGEAHCLIRATTDFSGGRLMIWNIPQKQLSLTQDSINFIYADYNSGSPQYAVTTNRDTINNSNKLPVFRAWAEDNTVEYYMDYGQIALGNPSKNFDRVMRIRGENGIEHEDGLTLGVAGAAARVVTISGGDIWFGLKRIGLVSVQSNVDNCHMYQTDSHGNWYDVDVTTFNNLFYDNRAGTVTLTVNRYAVTWVYRNVYTSEIDMIMGTGDYTSAQAIAETEPSKPPQFEWFYYLVGKIIVQRGGDSSTASVYQNDTTSAFGGSVATDHGGLTGLADDDHVQYARVDATRNITGNQTFDSSVTVSGNFGVVGNITRPLSVRSTSTFYSDAQFAGEVIGPTTFRDTTTLEAVTLARSNIYMADDTIIGITPTSGNLQFDDQTIDEVIMNGRFGVNTAAPQGALELTESANGRYQYFTLVPGVYNATGMIIGYTNHYSNFAYTNSAGSFLSDSSTGDFVCTNYDAQNTRTTDILFGTGSGPTTVMKVLGHSDGVEILGTKYLGVGGNICSSNTAGTNNFFGQIDAQKNVGVGGNLVSSGTTGSNRFAGEVNAEKNVGVGGVLISSSTTGTSSFAKNVSVSGLLSGANIISSNTASIAGMLSGGNFISSGTALITNGLISKTSSTLYGRTLIDASTTFIIGTCETGDPVAIGIGVEAGDFEHINSRVVIQSPGDSYGALTLQANKDGGDDGISFITQVNGDNYMQINNAESGVGYKSVLIGAGAGGTNHDVGYIKLYDYTDTSNARVTLVSTGTSFMKNYMLFLSSVGVDQNQKFYVSTIATSGSNLYIQSPINFESDAIRLAPAGYYQYTSTITFLSENLVIDPYDDLIIKGASLVNYGNLETLTNLSAGGVIYSSGAGNNQFTGAIDSDSSITASSITSQNNLKVDKNIDLRGLFIISNSTTSNFKTLISTAYAMLPAGSNSHGAYARNIPFSPNGNNQHYIVKDSSYNWGPTMLLLDDGRLILLYKKGNAHGSGVCNIVQRYSYDMGITWSAETIVLNGVVDSREYYEPSLSKLKSGRLVLTHYYRNPAEPTNVPDAAGWQYSDDNGATWSTAQYLNGPYTECLGCCAPAIEMDNHNLLWPTFGKNTGDTRFITSVWISTDSGASFGTEVVVASAVATIDYGEGNAVQLQNGDVYMLMRVDENGDYPRRYWTKSSDYGLTWTTPVKTFNDSAPPRLIQLNNGKLVTIGRRDIVVLPDADTNAGPMVRVSTDNGVTWGDEYRIDNAKTWNSCEYGWLTEISRNVIAATYGLDTEVQTSTCYIKIKYLYDGGGVSPLGEISSRGLMSMDADIQACNAAIVVKDTTTAETDIVRIDTSGILMNGYRQKVCWGTVNANAPTMWHSKYGTTGGTADAEVGMVIENAYPNGGIQLLGLDLYDQYIHFNDDKNSGGFIKYSHPTNTMSFRTNNLSPQLVISGSSETLAPFNFSTGRLLMSSGTLSVAGVSYFGGNVGIGNTSPEAKLHVSSSQPVFDGTDAGFKVRYQNVNNVTVDATSTGGVLNVRSSAGAAVISLDARTPKITTTGYVQIGSKTAAELRALAPGAVAQMFFNTDDLEIYYSTGTGTGAWVSVIDKTAP